MPELEEDVYTYRTLPWFSKSTIISYRFCPYLFFLRYIRGESWESGLPAETGTNMHAIYDAFFDVINMKELERIPINHEEELLHSRVYDFMHKTAMEMIPVDSREYNVYKTLIKNFAILEAQHWIKLNDKYNGNFNTVFKYFKPVLREQYVEAPIVQLFGTIDRENNHEEDGVELKEIYDYKTGHIPKSVLAGPKKPGDEYSWELPTEKSFELHFYLVLEMIRRGYRLHPDIVEYITNDEYFIEDSGVPKVKDYFFDAHGDLVDYKNMFRLGIIYLNGDQPYVPKKIPGKRSLTSVFSWINRLRTMIHNNDVFIKEPNFWKCKNCSLISRCLNEEETKLIFGETPYASK